MIIGRKLKFENDLGKVIEILKSHNIPAKGKTDDIIYVLEDNEEIVGVCNVGNHREYGILKYIAISKEHTGKKFGDSLLRATLNACIRKSMYKVFYPDLDEYLLHFGFDKVKTESRGVPEDLKNEVQGEEVLVCDIESFFSKGCKCKG